MKINLDGGFIEASRDIAGKIGITIGCEHFNPDGTRKDTVINAASVTDEEFMKLFGDVFSPDDQEELEDQEE